MKNAGEFFFWIILGGIFALFCALYDMLWLSPRGKDIVSQIKKNRV